MDAPWPLLVCFCALTTACGGGSEESDGDGGGDGDGAGSGGTSSPNEPLPETTVSEDEDWLTAYESTGISVTSTESDCDVPLSALTDSGAAHVQIGSRALYVGYAQVTSNNQDPVVALVDGETVVWCKHHEDDGPDGRANGISWDGGDVAYVTYSIVGGGSDLEGKGGWLPSYAPGAISGGGPKVSVVGRVDVETGELLSSTFVVAVTMDGKVNTHNPAAAATMLADGTVEFLGESAHKPIGVDGANSMECTDYPFETRYRFSADLSELVCAESSNCSANQLACD